MDVNRFTEKTQQTLAQALDLAMQQHHSLLEDLHLLSTLITLDGPSRSIIQSISDKSTQIQDQIEAKLELLPTTHSTTRPQISSTADKILKNTLSLSQQYQDEFIAQEMILLAIVQSESVANSILKQGSSKL